MSQPIRLGLVGLGKIARDQHLPAIAADPKFALVAVASRNATAEVPSYRDLATMLGEEPAIDAVVLCQPPQVRFEAARAALLAGKHVFLEKPPGATLSEVEALISLARAQQVSLFASWHSREAAGVAAARSLLRERTVTSARIAWKEDVRVWHPGQDWIWQPGGFGVFDPGINALSILTTVLPEPVRLLSARLEVPENCHAPIAATLALETASGVPIAAEFDFLQTGPQTWDIVLSLSDGSEVKLAEGGNRLFVDGTEQPASPEREYPALYERFGELIEGRNCDVDLAPLRLVADAFLAGETGKVSPFIE